MTEREGAILDAVCIYGLHHQPSELSPPERADQLRIVTMISNLQRGVPTEILVQAARFGMKNVWPFTDQGYFDASDLMKNLVKAKAAASAMRRRGEIPMSGAEAKRLADDIANGNEQSNG